MGGVVSARDTGSPTTASREAEDYRGLEARSFALSLGDVINIVKMCFSGTGVEDGGGDDVCHSRADTSTGRDELHCKLCGCQGEPASDPASFGYFCPLIVFLALLFSVSVLFLPLFISRLSLY